MPHVATFLTDPANAILDDSLANKLQTLLGAQSVDWLAEGIAFDIPLPETIAISQARPIIEEVIADAPVDFAIQDAGNRRKKALIADMDSTMIDQECIDELADEAGLGNKVAEITRRAMNGEVEFEPALRERVALLGGQPASVIDKVIDERISLAPGARELVATMTAHSAYTALVSGGFDSFTQKIAQLLGFEENRANRLEIVDGILSGRVIEPVLGRQAKVDALYDIAREKGLQPEDFIAVGDGANDLDMLALAGTGVALHAKPSVAAQAKIRIDHGDLTALLYLQGYRRSQFVK
jgi:phosphoserine phosphatase